MLPHAQITDAELYYDDKSLIGIAKEFSIPALETGHIEHETLGSVGVLKLPRRGLSALDGSMMLQLEEPEIARQMLRPNKAMALQLHAKIDAFNSFGHDEENSTVLVTHVRAMFGKIEPGDYKKGEAMAFNGEFSTTYFMQRVTNSETPLVEIDLFANIYKVNGEHVWPR